MLVIEDKLDNSIRGVFKKVGDGLKFKYKAGMEEEANTTARRKLTVKNLRLNCHKSFIFFSAQI